MEGINNKIGRLTRMAYGYRDMDFLHLRTTPSMSQKTYSPTPQQRTNFSDVSKITPST